jgi:hypothetical protein
LLAPGDAALARRVQAAGPTWTIRRMLAEQSRRLLEKYRAGHAADQTCPLQQALYGADLAPS